MNNRTVTRKKITTRDNTHIKVLFKIERMKEMSKVFEDVKMFNEKEVFGDIGYRKNSDDCPRLFTWAEQRIDNSMSRVNTRKLERQEKRNNTVRAITAFVVVTIGALGSLLSIPVAIASELYLARHSHR